MGKSQGPFTVLASPCGRQPASPMPELLIRIGSTISAFTPWPSPVKISTHDGLDHGPPDIPRTVGWPGGISPSGLQVPIICPSWSGCMFVLVQGPAEAVVSSDVEVDDSGLVGHRFGYGTQRRSLVQRCNVRCGRCSLSWISNARRACSRCTWFQIKVRSRSSCRQVRTQRSMMAFGYDGLKRLHPDALSWPHLMVDSSHRDGLNWPLPLNRAR